MERLPCVYLLASGRNGPLYDGVTSNLINRVAEQRQDLLDGLTRRSCVHDLVWYEIHATLETAILREKQIKGWDRKAKLRLIEQGNPDWRDLCVDLTDPSLEPRPRHSLPGWRCLQIARPPGA